MADRVLIVRPGALGDLILTLPAIAAIRSMHPQAQITLAANAQFYTAALPVVDRLMDFDSREMLRIITGDGDHYSHAYVWLREPEDVIVRNLRACGAEVVWAPSFQEAESLPQSEFLLSGIGGRGPAKPRMILTAEEQASVIPRDVVVFHPGAGSPSKRWPLDSFLALADLIKQEGFRVQWIRGPAEDNLRLPLSADQIESLDLRRLAVLLSGARGFLGNDSGVTHLAAACGCPSLALFGPTNPRVWASGPFLHTPGPLPIAPVQDVLDRLIQVIHHKQE